MMAEPSEDPDGEEASGGGPAHQREHSPMLHLDLYNFECPEAEGSRYVLTSPRSLEACARCIVKPVELLCRSLSDLIREAPGRSMRVATGLCEVYEIERQRKLKMCREERERIIRQEKRRILPLVMSSNLGSPTSSKAPSRAESSTSAVPKRYDSPSHTGTRRSNTPISDSERSKSLPSKGTQKAKLPPSKKQQAPVSKTRKGSASQSEAPLDGGDSSKLTSSVPKKNKSQSLDSLQKMRDGSSGRTSSDSMTSSYSGDSFQGRTTQFIPKSRTLDAVNSLMGRSFSLGDLSHSPQTTKKVEKMVKEVKRRGIQELPSRDRKIAAIMIARHEEENIRNEQRYWAHLHWETQRRTSDLQKEQDEKARQRALYQGQKMLESQIRVRRGRSTATISKTKSLPNDTHFSDSVPGIEKHKTEESEKGKTKAKEKTQQEQSATPKQLNDGLFQDKLLAAQQKKQEKAIQQQVNKILQNKMEKMKHQVLYQELSQKEESDNEELRKNLERNLHKAQENADLLQEKKQRELKSRAQREELQIQRARQAAEQKEKERAEHLKELARAAERKLQHASQIADEVVQHKAKKAVESRLEKEKIQRENRKKVQQIEDLKRQELLLSIERKLERSEQIFKGKQTVLDNARSVARASFNIRERVRSETNMRTFDKMAREAEFYANIDKK